MLSKKSNILKLLILVFSFIYLVCFKVDIIYGNTKEDYYMSVFTDLEKEQYRILDANIKNHSETFTLPKSDDVEKLKELFYIYKYEHPEYFYLRSLYLKYYVNKDGKPISDYTCKVNYNYTKEESEKISKNIDRISNIWLEEVDKDTSELNKVEQIINIIARNIEYHYNYNEEQLNHCQTIDSVFLDRKTVCSGYAEAFKYLCDKIGIESICVGGTLDGQNHLWNKVKIDNIWYNLDITNADENETLNYLSLLVSDNDFIGYEAQEYFAIPKCTTSEINYYVRNNLRIDKYSKGKSEKLIDYIKSNNLKKVTILSKNKKVLAKLEKDICDAYNVKLTLSLSMGSLKAKNVILT